MRSEVKDTLLHYQSQCQQLLSALPEHHRRHVAGLFALALGHGGVQFFASLVGLDRDTVSRGKHELLNNFADCPVGRQRKPGGGRHPVEKKVLKSSRSSKK